MAEQDDDTPPALSSLSNQVIAAQPNCDKTGPTRPVPSASVTLKNVNSKPAPLKSGFLNSSHPKRSSKSSAKGKDESTPFIKAASTSKVPDMFMLPPDAQEKQYTALRQKLVSDLMPTEQNIGDIASNKELMAGFDDPDVMQAVADVAQNPASINKYKNNKKVQRFYQQMGGVMAARCNDLGASGPQQDTKASKAAAQSAKQTVFPEKPVSISSRQKRSTAQCEIEEL